MMIEYSPRLAGKRLRRAREKAGLTQEKCAAIIREAFPESRCSHMRISRHERGLTSLPIEEIHALAPHLRVSPAYLLLLTAYETMYTVKQLNDSWQKGYDRGFKDGKDAKEALFEAGTMRTIHAKKPKK